MKLLNFLCLCQIFLTIEVALCVFAKHKVLAQEISEASGNAQTYQRRYNAWVLQQEQRTKALRKKLNSERQRAFTKTVPLREQNPLIPPKPKKAAELPKALPAKVLSSEDMVNEALAAVYDEDPPQKPQALQNSKASQYPDAQSDFLTNIPKDNKQVQSLLTMINHSKVYFSINSEGQLRDFLSDPRFQEIYKEEMTKPTQKMTYNFFKGLQDENRNPNEPVAQTLNRDIKLTSDKIQTYLNNTGIKSKLTRALQGRYPKPTLRAEESSSSVETSDEATPSGQSVP